MRSFVRLILLVSLCLALEMWATGCHNNQQPATSSNAEQNGQPAATDEGADTANLVPVAAVGAGAQAPEAQQPSENEQYSEPNLPPSEDTADESEYGIQPEETASQPPPPLPDYDQPPCPGPNDIWTPGYWYWGSAGYYWVPGAWVAAPYVGALWTPGYWVFHSGRYAFYPGYWGRYVGFYGGISYGFGYTGYGYRGGYWHNGAFAYNRAVNNVNLRNVYAYNYNVPSNGTRRVSYNGGPGGLQVRPRVAELAALREPHAPAMTTQIQVRQQAATNRAQFASNNHGRPAEAAFTRPVAAEHGVTPRPQTVRNLPAAARPAPEIRRVTPNRPVTNQPGANRNEPVNREGPPREGSRQNQPGYPEGNHPEHPQPQTARPEPQRSYPAQAEPSPSRQREAPQHRAEPTRTQPEQRAEPAPREQQRTEPAPRQQQRTEPAQREPQRAQPAPRRTEPTKPEERKPSPDHREEPK